jgi:hypothetical protein
MNEKLVKNRIWTATVTNRHSFDEIPYRLYYSNVWLKQLQVLMYMNFL